MTQAASLPSPTTGTVDERIAAIAEFHLLAAAAMRAINGVMDAESPVVMGWSSGKDSSVLVSLAFAVAVARKENGRPVPRMLVVHTDTGVESPAVRQLADGELEKMQAYADLHGLPLQIRIGHPSLYTSWPVRVIGGRALPSFPNWKCRLLPRLEDKHKQSPHG